MNQRVLILVAGVALFGCGEKSREAQNAINALKQVADASTGMAATQEEALRVQQERRERGDTLSMPYADLQKFLPSPPDGYTATEEPSGSSQSMGAFSMSQAQQKFSMPANPDGSTPPSIEVTIIDFGGTQAAYGMMALPMMMNISQEDAHRRMRTLKLDVPHTWASEEYNKDNKDAKLSAVTRYRYSVTIEARNQASDQSAVVRSMMEGLLKKFEGK